jgi:cysteine desulfurase
MTSAMGAVYFDNNATTPLDPRVREAMLPWLGDRHGNPSSVHRFGQAALAAVENARDQVAALLGATPPEIVFCSSGTEANNAVVFSCAGSRHGHLVVSALEHPSVHAAAERLEAEGCSVSRVEAGPDGRVDPGRIADVLRDDTRLVCLMLASNELGTVQPVREVAAHCRERGVPVLCDAVQAVSKVPVDVEELGVDYLTIGGHKFHGPLGAAALYVRQGAPLEPLLIGGGQERRRRAGTVNVPAVVGLGEAAKLAQSELEERSRRLAELRDRFEAGLAAVTGARVHCAESPRLPNTSHVAVDGVQGEALMVRLDIAGFAVSTGSACSSGVVEPSGVLLGMGLSTEEALSSLRVSVGIQNTADEVDRLLEAFERQVSELRAAAGATATS